MKLGRNCLSANLKTLKAFVWYDKSRVPAKPLKGVYRERSSWSVLSPLATPKMKVQCHAVSEDKLSSELKEMKELMVQMNERIQQLKSQPRNQNGLGS